MARTNEKRKAASQTSMETAVSTTFRIPCFAHQELDPTRFPEGVGSAIGGPMSWAKSTPRPSGDQGAWEEGSDADEDNELSDVSSTARATRVSAIARKRKRELKQKPKPDDSYKRAKVIGGRPATAKVTADLDSEDDIIIRMKNAKFPEKDIAQHLVDEGRIAYNPKTIGTRYARLMKVLQKQQDEQLDADLTDWHDGDDEVLEEAVARADTEVKKMKDTADARKWYIVADQMKHIKPVVNFSQNACRNRYEALKNGTAKQTPESVLDPDEKTQERINSRLEKQRRIEEDAAHWNLQKSNLEGNSWTSRAVKYFV